MTRIKDWNNFNINEENKWRNLFFSALLSLGLTSLDAQEIQRDSLKTEVVKSILNYNKSKILNLSDDITLKRNLEANISKTIVNPEVFIDKYLKFDSDGTIHVSPNFIEGLELYMNKGKFGFGLKIDF